MFKRFLIVLACTLTLSSVSFAESFFVHGQCDVYFSPNGGATMAIVNLIDSAQKSVYVLAYSFTSPEIANALILAKQKGIDVKVIVDSSQLTSRGSKVAEVSAAGVPIWIDSKHSIAHNKVIIVDGRYLETGSFNFSHAAEVSNAENALICLTLQGAAVYKKNWDFHQSHSVKYGE